VKKRLKTEYLIQAYEDHNLSIRDLSNLCGLCPASVFERLKRGGAKMRAKESGETVPEGKKEPEKPPEGIAGPVPAQTSLEPGSEDTPHQPRLKSFPVNSLREVEGGKADPPLRTMKPSARVFSTGPVANPAQGNAGKDSRRSLTLAERIKKLKLSG